MIITLLSEAHSKVVYAIRTGDKDAKRKAEAWEAECWEAALIVRRYQQRVLLRQEAGITARQRLDLLREAAAEQMDVDMMRTP